MKNTYKMFLNILLIVILIAIIGIIAYITYDYISNLILTKEARKAAELFEQQVSQNTDYNEQTNNSILVDIGDENNQNNETTNISKPTTKPTTNAAKYKGYTVIGSIKIPKTNISYPVVDKISPNSVSVAVVALYGAGLNETRKHSICCS